MGKKKLASRSKLRPFVKVYNHNHMLPTRWVPTQSQRAVSIYSYTLAELNVDKNIVNKDSFTSQNTSRKRKALLEIKEKFEERYKTGKNRWFFTKLHF